MSGAAWSSSATSNVGVVRGMFAAFRAQQREVAERLLDDHFVFTSPQDDHIDKATYLERCFPTADRFVDQRLIELVDDGDDHVFALYEYELQGGERYRNTEVVTLRDGRLVETQVFFGGQVARV